MSRRAHAHSASVRAALRTVEREIPVRAVLTFADGRTFQLKELFSSELLSKESRDNLLAVLRSFA